MMELGAKFHSYRAHITFNAINAEYSVYTIFLTHFQEPSNYLKRTPETIEFYYTKSKTYSISIDFFGYY